MSYAGRTLNFDSCGSNESLGTETASTSNSLSVPGPRIEPISFIGGGTFLPVQHYPLVIVIGKLAHEIETL